MIGNTTNSETIETRIKKNQAQIKPNQTKPNETDYAMTKKFCGISEQSKDTQVKLIRPVSIERAIRIFQPSFIYI